MADAYAKVPERPAARGGAAGGGITNSEMLLVLVSLFMSCVSFAAGILFSYTEHRLGGHHTSAGQGVCESARLCESYLPRALCNATLE